SQVAFGFFRQQTQGVDGLSRSDEVKTRLAALFLHQSKLQHGRHVKRSHETLESHFQFFGRMPAQFHARIQILRRLAISICLLLLLARRWRRRHRRFLGGHGLLGHSRRFFGRRRARGSAGHFFLRNFFAQLTLRCKQTAISYDETFLLLLSHSFPFTV